MKMASLCLSGGNGTWMYYNPSIQCSQQQKIMTVNLGNSSFLFIQTQLKQN